VLSEPWRARTSRIAVRYDALPRAGSVWRVYGTRDDQVYPARKKKKLIVDDPDACIRCADSNRRGSSSRCGPPGASPPARYESRSRAKEAATQNLAGGARASSTIRARGQVAVVPTLPCGRQATAGRVPRPGAIQGVFLADILTPRTAGGRSPQGGCAEAVRRPRLRGNTSCSRRAAGNGKTYLAMAFAGAPSRQARCGDHILTLPSIEPLSAAGSCRSTLEEKGQSVTSPALRRSPRHARPERLVRSWPTATVESPPLAVHSRGRTLNDSFIVLDEAQNNHARSDERCS